MAGKSNRSSVSAANASTTPKLSAEGLAVVQERIAVCRYAYELLRNAVNAIGEHETIRNTGQVATSELFQPRQVVEFPQDIKPNDYMLAS